mgnify:CR=1 FL=1
MATPQHFIGLMSGTSVDGVDGVLARLRDGVAARASSHALARGLTQRFKASLAAASPHPAA